MPCSSEPSQISLTPHGKLAVRPACSARSAVRCMTMLPLQSAAPRPYQRPSRSVSSKTGRLPGVLAERRLDVVVAVQQHGRRARPAPGAWPCTALLPSGVGDSVTSCSPTSANASTTHCAAFSHSSGGYCFGSATDLNATSSARSSFARPIRPATAPRRSSAAWQLLSSARRYREGAGWPSRLGRDRVRARRGGGGAVDGARRTGARWRADQQDERDAQRRTASPSGAPRWTARPPARPPATRPRPGGCA